MIITFPEIYKTLYRELQSIPLYKTEQGYQFATFLLQSENQSTAICTFLDSEEIPNGLTKETAQHGRKVFRETIDRLSKICITDDALVGWQTFQKEIGDVETYHHIFTDLYNALVLEQFQAQLITEPTDDAVQIESEMDGKRQLRVQGETITLPDFQVRWETSNQQPVSSDIVLNHNNPFADISIKEQSFIYGSMLGQFESLGLTTSHTVTKIAKDTERSYLALQPGFKIKRSKHIEKQEKQDVIFDDTITTEITQQDENIYVYIN